MQNLLLEEINNNIVFGVIIPLLLFFLECIRKGHEVKVKNKKLGYWIKKCKRLKTYIDISMKIYIGLLAILLLAIILRLLLKSWIGEFVSYAIIGTIYIIISGLCVVFSCRNKKAKIEFLSNGKYKKILLFFLYLIFIFAFFLEGIKKFVEIPDMLFPISLVIWMISMFRCCDTVFVLENSYANIYVKGNETAEQAEAGSIKKQGEWIIVNRHINGYFEEIRIKESDIVRIDYYGEPIITVEKWRLFKRE